MPLLFCAPMETRERASLSREPTFPTNGVYTIYNALFKKGTHVLMIYLALDGRTFRHNASTMI